MSLCKWVRTTRRFALNHNEPSSTHVVLNGDSLITFDYWASNVGVTLVSVGVLPGAAAVFISVPDKRSLGSN